VNHASFLRLALLIIVFVAIPSCTTHPIDYSDETDVGVDDLVYGLPFAYDDFSPIVILYALLNAALAFVVWWIWTNKGEGKGLSSRANQSLSFVLWYLSGCTVLFVLAATVNNSTLIKFVGSFLLSIPLAVGLIISEVFGLAGTVPMYNGYVVFGVLLFYAAQLVQLIRLK